MSDAGVLAALRATLPSGSERSLQRIAVLTPQQIGQTLLSCGLSEQDAEVASSQWEEFLGEEELVAALASIETWLEANFAQVRLDFPIWDDLFEHGANGRFLYLYAAALGAERVSSYLNSLGVSKEITKATLEIVQRHVAIYKMKWDELGTDAGWWLLLMLRGVLYQCGSLQYHRLEIGVSNLAPNPWFEEAEAKKLGEGFNKGDEGFGLHIPQRTDLSPAAVENSFKLAQTTFDTAWPSNVRRLFTLQSWLLDPQLKRFLNLDSNIVQFQNRFEIVGNPPVADDDTIEFVFRRPGVPLKDLPRESALQRGVLEVLESGGHWHAAAGWLK